MKKGWLLLIVVVLCMMTMPVSCDKAAPGGLEYHPQGDGTCSVKGTNCQGDVVIPEVSPNGEAVTHIWGFFDCDGMQSVTVPASVTSINSESFAECPELKSITVVEDNPIFHSENNCIIETASDTLIAGCQTSTIPDYVTIISAGAFNGCEGLKSLTIPVSVTEIGSNALCNCPDLQSIKVEKDNPVYHSQDNCLIETETNILILGCKNSKIPDYILKIGHGAFAGCVELKTVKIPDGVTEIGARAFENCTRLKKIHIPASVENMYFGAFNGCSGLNSITVAKENTVFYSVDDCLIIKSSGMMMLGCKNSKIPKDVTIIGQLAFGGCTGLKKVTIPDSVTEIGSEAFCGCTGLKKVTIPDSVTNIWEGAFKDCTSLKSMTIPDGVSIIEGWTFEGCSGLKSITIPDSVTRIGQRAFLGCSSLEGVTISNSITEIGLDAFTDCTKLIEVKDGVHIVDGWIVGYGEVASCVTLSEIRGIGEYAFDNCANLTEISLEGSFTVIGRHQFSHCTNLTKVTIPQGVTEIGEYAFSRCTALEQIRIPEGVIRIDEGVFLGCSALEKVTIPDSVTSLGEHIFLDCSKLKNIYYTGTEEQWANFNIETVASNDGLAHAKIHFNSVPKD